MRGDAYVRYVHAPADELHLTLPRSAVGDFVDLSAGLLERMHALLERNTDDALSIVEREELDTLVQMAHFGQIVSMALDAKSRP